MSQKTVIALALSTLVVLGACRKETEQEKAENWMGTSTDTSATAPDTASATHPGSPGGTALVPEVDSGTTVMVVLEDNSIGVQEGQSIPPGPAVLSVENRGSEVHNLFIEGNGISRAAGDAITEGTSRTVDLNFKPGTYTLYCPVGDHRKNGEQATITIAAP